MILTKTYREQNQQIMQILRLTHSGEAKEARKLLPNINMQYSTELHHIISLGTYNQTLNKKMEDLQEQVDELTIDLKKAIRDKEQTKQKSRIKMGQNTSDAAKVKIFNLLENDDFNLIQRIVKDQKFDNFGKIVQQAWEYRWILSKYDQLMITTKTKSTINKFKELTFLKNRKWLQSLILGTTMTTMDINNQFLKIVQAIETNGKVMIDNEKSLVQPININLLLRINQKQQILKSQLVRRCKDLSQIQERIKQANMSFGKTVAITDDSCADMVYKLAMDYEQLRYDLEQQNPSNKLERKKSVEQKIGLIEFKYWFDWLISTIEMNKPASVNIPKHFPEKEVYREKFQCIRKIILKSIQSKQQRMTSREQQMTDKIQNLKIKLQSFNQNVVINLQSLDKFGGALLDLGKISLQESVRILCKNINLVLSELKYHRQQHLLLSEYKSKSISEKWEQEYQMVQFNLKSKKSQGYQENAIEIRLRIEMSELKLLHEELKESSLKYISEKQAQIIELNKRIEDLKQDIVTETDAKKQLQKHIGKLRSKIMNFQKSIFESQIIEKNIDFDVDQSELKTKLEELTLENQNLKTQIEEKDQWFADLKNQMNLKLKSAEDKYELKIEEWRYKYKQYQQDRNLNNQKLQSQIQEKEKSIIDLKDRMKAKLKSVEEKCELKIEEWRQKCKQYQADLLQSYNNIQMMTENQQEMMKLRKNVFSTREPQVINNMPNIKIQLQSLNRKIINQFQDLDTIGIAQLFSNKEDQLSSVRIISDNTIILLNVLKFYNQKYLLLLKCKNNQVVNRSYNEKNNQVIKYREETGENLLKQIEQQNLIAQLKKKIEDLNQEQYKRINIIKQKAENNSTKLEIDMGVSQISIFQSQILSEFDSDIVQIQFKQNSKNLAIQNQNLRYIITEKQKQITKLKNQHLSKLKIMEKGQEKNIEEWMEKCKKIQEQLKQSYKSMKRNIYQKDKKLMKKLSKLNQEDRSFPKDEDQFFQNQWLKQSQKYPIDILQQFKQFE